MNTGSSDRDHGESTGRLQKIIKLLTLQNIVLFIELFALPLGVYAIFQAEKAIKLQIQANKDQTRSIDEQIISSAWQLLTTVSPGNSGKGRALTTLNKNGVTLSNLVITCESMGGRFQKDETFLKDMKECKGAPVIQKMEITNTDAEFDMMDFSGAHIRDSMVVGRVIMGFTANNSFIAETAFIGNNIYNMSIKNSRVYNLVFLVDVPELFSNLDLEMNGVAGLELNGSYIQGGGFSEVVLEAANFSDAKFANVDFKNTKFETVNVSNTNFCSTWFHYDPEGLNVDEKACSQGLTEENLKGMWAWDDQPPVATGKLATELKKHVKLCDHALRNDYFKKTMDTEYGMGTINRGYTVPEQCK